MPPIVRRRIKLINRSFQYGLIAKFIVVNAAVTALFGMLLFFFFSSEVGASLASAHAAYRSVSQMLLPIFLTLSLLTILVTSLGIAVVVLYASHKIAGPMFRFNSAVKEMAARNLKALTSIRKEDQLWDLSVSLTEMRDVLAGDQKELKRLVGQLEQKVGSEAELEPTIGELRQLVGKYNV